MSEYQSIQEFEFDVLALLNKDFASPDRWQKLLAEYQRSWRDLLSVVALQAEMEEITIVSVELA